MRLLRISAGLLLVAGLTVTSRGWAADAPGVDGVKSSKPNKNTELFGDSVVAKGKGFEIKRSQLDDEVIRLKALSAARNQPIPPDQAPLLEKQILEQLIQIQLLLGKATEADKAKGKELAQQRLDDAKKQLGSDEAFTRRLRSEGLTQDQLFAKWTEAGTAESVVKRDLKTTVTEDDAKKYYEDNPAKFEEPERVRAAHILISTKDPATGSDLPDDKKAAKRKQMEELLKRAKTGQDFAKMAQENSEDPGSKDKGGEYTFPRGQMVPEFESAAFSLNTNQVSDIITTSYGYHIIKLYEKLPAKKEQLAGLDTKTIFHKPDGGVISIKDILTDQSMQKQFPDYMRSLRKEANVEILDDKLKMEDVPPTSNTGNAPGVPLPSPNTGGNAKPPSAKP